LIDLIAPERSRDLSQRAPSVVRLNRKDLAKTERFAASDVYNQLAPATQRRFPATHKGAGVIFRRMTRSECLRRSVECCRLAESVIEPEMKVYLLRLALSWMQAATSADERLREEA
jgi:hypothetical protein